MVKATTAAGTTVLWRVFELAEEDARTDLLVSTNGHRRAQGATVLISVPEGATPSGYEEFTVPEADASSESMRSVVPDMGAYSVIAELGRPIRVTGPGLYRGFDLEPPSMNGILHQPVMIARDIAFLDAEHLQGDPNAAPLDWASEFTRLPPGWQVAPKPTGSASLEALSPNLGRVLALALFGFVVLAIFTLIALDRPGRWDWYSSQANSSTTLDNGAGSGTDF